jgi:actin-related protein 8
MCLFQESLAATYGAGISSACVVDIGAVKTSVACVDEGLIISDSRYAPSVFPGVVLIAVQGCH